MQEAARRTFWHGRSSGYWGLCFIAEEANSTISMTKGASAPTLNLVTSVNRGKTWETFTPGVTTITLAKKGDSVWFAAGEGGNARTASSSATSTANSFSMTGRVSANGSIMSLLNASEPTYECGSQYTFSCLFINCTSLTSTPELPATTLTSGCYSYMFRGCTSLTVAPTLPAETLASSCYIYMFLNCTSLTAAPALPAETLANHCYSYMFSGCTSLASAPALPAETLADYCYSYMFRGCTSLTTAPALPAETLASSCYAEMFQGCTSLTVAPVLPAEKLMNFCYSSMFYGCTSLTTASALPAKTLANDCYFYMFYGCTSLTTAPVLPAETLADDCYNHMFMNCTSLTTAPELPATTLANYCYGYMFSGCTSLTSAPELPATTTAYSCYSYMFDGCSSLKYIKSNSVTSQRTNWVRGVASEGIFECPFYQSYLPTTISYGNDACPPGWQVVNTEEMVYIRSDMGGDKIKFTKTGTPSDINIVYSTDKKTWTTYDAQTCPEVALPIYLKAGNGGNSFGTGTSNYWQLKIVSSMSSGKYVYMYGYARSLLNADDRSLTVPSYAFYKFLSDNMTLAYTHAFYLSATTLASNCYSYMFQGCVSLTTAPALPATTMADHCYSGMFQGCSSLTTEMNLPATTLANGCYADMFNGCSLLSRISVGFNAWGSSNATSNWVSNVAQDGTFSCPAALGTAETIECGVSRCPVGWTVKMIDHVVAFIAEEAGCVINMASEQDGSTPIPSLSLEYSRDGISWTDFDTSVAHVTPITLTNINDIVLFRAKNPNTAFSSADDTARNWFTTSKRCKVRGNVMALLNSQDEDLTTISDVFTLAYLFYECKITDASELKLPATTLADNCYQYMFGSCAYLVAAPELPATTLANYCYQYMFDGCSSLATAPELPASTLSVGCYCGMFNGCAALTKAPHLRAQSLVQNCYSNMFSYCSSLSEIVVDFTSWLAGGTSNWLKNVSANGNFICSITLGTNQTIARGASNCPENWNAVTSDWGLYLEAVDAGASIQLKKSGNPSTISLEYSTDGAATWRAYSIGTAISLPSVGSKVYFRSGITGNATISSTSSAYFYFTEQNSKRIAAHGNIMSLLDRKNPFATAITTNYAFAYLFYNCTSLTTAPELPATTLANYCYSSMFQGCTSLTTAPTLPTEILANDCYYRMFYGCTSLATAPALPSETLATYCYYEMFRGCTSLTSAPALPATTLVSYCYYYMFQDCTSLTTAPALPAMTLASYCYTSMFRNCTSLTTAPELPATTLASSCYNSMFFGCTALTTVPALPAETLASGCYQGMFSGCTSLTVAPELPATKLAQSCYRQMFYGCTSLTTAPDLPATTANALTYVYYRMFYNCTGLERSGSIAIATATGSNALAQMFYGCSNLQYIELSSMTTWSTRMANWVNGVAATGTFKCPAALGTDSTITRGTSNCPTGWNVVNI